MSENPLKVFETLDPVLLKAVEDNRELALSDGALPKKYKYLIAFFHKVPGPLSGMYTSGLCDKAYPHVSASLPWPISEPLPI